MRNGKKVLAVGISAAMLMGFSANVGALEYGEEWSSYYHAAPTTYSDVPSSYWAYNAIMRTTEKNWFSGYPDGSFRPTASITRAEALKVFVQFLGLELSDVTKSSFYDVDANKWYAPYIEAGKDLFPTHTTVQGKVPFNPEMPVTREDTVYALVKALGCDVGIKYVDQSILNMFNDKSSISGDIKNSFVIALTEGLVSGYPDNTIRAQAALTRAEFATLLMRGTEHGFHDTYVAKVESVTVTPASPVSMTIGDSITLSARATYSDGTNKEYTDLQAYDPKNSGIVSISGNTVTAVKEGTVTIKYNATDLTGTETKIVVAKPDTKPTLKVTNYPDSTEDRTVTVGGIVTDASGSVSLTCNGKDVAVGSDGSFSASVILTEGENEIEFVAENMYGVTTSKTIKITRAAAEADDDDSDEDLKKKVTE